jgi:ABC-2 type transport system ATP-binding protein
VELLERVGLSEAADRKVRGYSGGMKRRLDLALALVHRPRILFLDEPTTGLDVQSRSALWEEVARLAQEDGVTVFLTTQYLEEADRLADQIAVLNGGLLVAVGTAAELKQRVAAQRLDLTCSTAGAFEQVSRLLADRVVHLDPAARIVGAATDGSAAQVRALLDQADPARDLVASFAVRGATLDDVFFALTGPAQEVAHV